MAKIWQMKRVEVNNETGERRAFGPEKEMPEKLGRARMLQGAWMKVGEVDVPDPEGRLADSYDWNPIDDSKLTKPKRVLHPHSKDD